MADQIDYFIHGDDMQAVSITLDPRETVRAEPGAMMWMEDGVEMATSTGGGMMSGLKRAFSGESFFITSFTNEGDLQATVGFAAEYPGKIIPVDLSRGEVLCQRNAYLCSAHGIEISVAFTKRLGAGFFGGEGFILQRLRGDGLAFIHAGGHVIERELQQGETLRVDTGCIVGFEASVDYDIRMVKGVKTMLFGGEGLFLAELTGPGKCWVQTAPLSRLANRIMSASGSSKGEHNRFGGVSNMAGRFFGGD
ncbi:MAG: TIGR00266 family protein [Planctomycetota bacterium]|nr:TIGR00266 family protein [Planctomycetota bacterium]MDG2144055.1 TIGR00266 family protein [Planctomycetota bacterium]